MSFLLSSLSSPTSCPWPSFLVPPLPVYATSIIIVSTLLFLAFCLPIFTIVLLLFLLLVLVPVFLVLLLPLPSLISPCRLNHPPSLLITCGSPSPPGHPAAVSAPPPPPPPCGRLGGYCIISFANKGREHTFPAPLSPPVSRMRAGEQNTKRLAKAVDAAVMDVHELLLDVVSPALDMIVFRLGELQGLAACSDFIRPIELQVLLHFIDPLSPFCNLILLSRPALLTCLLSALLFPLHQSINCTQADVLKSAEQRCGRLLIRVNQVMSLDGCSFTQP